MKISKNKILLFFNSAIIYLCLILVTVFCSLVFAEQYANRLLIKNSTVKSADYENIYEILIDDASIQSYPKWNGETYADLLDYFYTYAKPKVIGFDINFDTLDSNTASAKQFTQQISKMKNIVFALVPIKQSQANSTDKLSEASQSKYALEVEPEDTNLNTKFSGIVGHNDKFNNYVSNYGSVYMNLNSGSNFVTMTPDIIKIDKSYFASLPLKVYLLEHNTNKIIVTNKHIIIPETGLKIPYSDYDYDNGTVTSIIRFYKNLEPYTLSHNNISAKRILDTYKALKSGITPQKYPDRYDLNNGLINPEYFKNKIIFIGNVISSENADVFATPMGERHPGVDVQATIYDNFRNGHFLQPTGVSAAFASFILLSLIAFVLILKMTFLRGLISVIIVDILYLILVAISAANGYLMTYATPIIGQFVTAIFAYSFKFITENRNKEKIKQAMGKYLSQDVMKNVVNNIDDLKLGGKRAVVTVLFSDIRGFTSLSEKMSAEEVSVILNEYFAEMEPIITKYNGVINKFIGDAVMAIFGEPIKDENHPQNAVMCAYEMLKKVEYLREKWLFEGKPKIEIGVGINTGEVFIGNIGTETRMEYTVIGDTVNLASRIESYNKVYKTNLLVSNSTYSYISSIADVIKISEVQIRGKAKKMDIYEVLRIMPDKEKGRI